MKIKFRFTDTGIYKQKGVIFFITRIGGCSEEIIKDLSQRWYNPTIFSGRSDVKNI